MSLSHSIPEYVAAGFSGLWIQSHEHDDAVNELASLCRDRQWWLAAWDLERGFVHLGSDNSSKVETAADPLSALRMASSLASSESPSLLVLRNFHRFLGSPEIIQAMERQLVVGKQQGTVLVVLSPVVQIPVELEKQFVVIEHDQGVRAR